MDDFSAKLLDRYMCIAYWYVFLCTNNKSCFTRIDRVRVLSLISIFQENRSSSITLHLHIPINIPAFNSGNQEQKPPRQPSRHFLAALLLLCRAILLPSETKHAKNNNPDADDEGQQYQLHLQIIPPHAIPQRSPLLVEIIRLEPQRLRLIYQNLDLFSSIQNFLDVIHHDFLYLADLLLHRSDFRIPDGAVLRAAAAQLLQCHRFFHLFLQRWAERSVQTVRVRVLSNRPREFLREDSFHFL